MTTLTRPLTAPDLESQPNIERSLCSELTIHGIGLKTTGTRSICRSVLSCKYSYDAFCFVKLQYWIFLPSFKTMCYCFDRTSRM